MSDIEMVAKRISRECTNEYGEIIHDEIIHHLRSLWLSASVGGWLLGTFTGACAVGIAWLVFT